MTNVDFKLIKQALSGDFEAARKYCGSYTLIKKNGEFFRLKGSDVPEGCDVIKGVYDNEGYLLPQYWVYPRI